MLNLDPVALYRTAAAGAVDVAGSIGPEQLGSPTPCAEWTVRDLLGHLVGGTEYLRAAIDGTEPEPPGDVTGADLGPGVERVMARLEDPAAVARTCTSPLGFTWTVAEALAGTAMDLVIHTWDLGRATGQDVELDAAVVETCVDLFLPDMPERGRAAGLVGPAVAVGPDASAQDRLLAAMGRTP
jgi:uncharacterized protein (TIGR03086 family)